jgi:thiamine-phosphate pyrophosphorylase
MTLADSARKLKCCRQKQHRLSALLPTPAFLFTDRRLLDPAAAVRALPVGAVVVIRGFSTAEKHSLGQKIAAIARQRRLTVVFSAEWRLADCMARQGLRVGIHLPEHIACHGVLAPMRLFLRRRKAPLTVACHTRPALARAGVLMASAAFLSPLFPTASHPGGPNLGLLRGALMARRAKVRVIALGGISERNSQALASRGFAGFAAISGWGSSAVR